MRIRPCVLDGVVQSHRNVQCLMGSDKGEFCHRFCVMYIILMDDLSVNLKECPTGCIAGGTIVNHSHESLQLKSSLIHLVKIAI